MEITPVKDLKAFERGKKIRVRIMRIWRPQHVSTQITVGLECILIDKEGECVEAAVKSWDTDYFIGKMTSGYVYDISNFHIDISKKKYRTVPHLCKLQFAKSTNIVMVTEVDSNFPLYKFHFVEYDELEGKINSDDGFVDVIGRLVFATNIEEIKTAEKSFKKREICIENFNQQRLHITLWSQMAMTFDEEIVQKMKSPIISIFTGMQVKQFEGKAALTSSSATAWYFNLDIPEIQIYKNRFKDEQLGSIFSYSKQKVAKTLSEILSTDLKRTKGASFDCNATVIALDVSHGWYYWACLQCPTQVKAHGSAWWCPKHGEFAESPRPWFKVNYIIEDETASASIIIFNRTMEQLIGRSCKSLVVEDGYDDPQTAPPNLNKILFQKKIFSLIFNPKSSSTISLIANDVRDDLPTILPPAALEKTEEKKTKKSQKDEKSAHEQDHQPARPKKLKTE